MAINTLNNHILHEKIVENYRSENLRVALGFCKKAIDEDINQPPWLYKTAIAILMKINNIQEAFLIRDRAVELYPDNDELICITGALFDKIDNKKEALKYYLEAIKININQPDWVYSFLVATFVEIRQFNTANRIARQGLKLYPDSLWIYYHLGQSYKFQEKWTEALDNFQAALSIDKNFVLANKSIARTLTEKETFEKTNLYYAKSIERYSKNYNSAKLYILDTHKQDVSGLGVVAKHCHSLGEIIEDGRAVAGKVLVADRPDIVQKLVRFENINYIWTTFESDRLPDSWVRAINTSFDRVFVPHKYVKQVFLNSGVNRQIDVIPQSYVKHERTKPISKQKDRLILGILGIPNERKNFDKLIEAVTQINREAYNVRLHIHCPKLLNKKQEKWHNLPFIKLTTGDLSNEQISQWYSELDAYIYPSSGEGWSFTPRESMSLGIPTIITDIPVHQELIESNFYLPIISDKWDDAYFEFLLDTCGRWKLYSVQNIKDSIIQAIEEYDRWYLQAQKGKEWVFNNHLSWSQIEQKLITEIMPER